VNTLALHHLKLSLRPYQEDALTRMAAAEERGIHRQLGVAATGLGKTIIFSALAEQRGGRTLILAHRDELVRQAADKIVQVWPEADVGIVKASDDEHDRTVVVASVQTLSRPNRLARLEGAAFDLVVVDEAHHATADSYQAILNALDYKLLLGVTATPDRGDGLGLDGVFDEITWNYDILWGITNGFLCNVRALRVRVEALDLTKVKMQRGDFAQGQAGQALEDAHAPEAIVAAWAKHASERRTIVFTPTVEVARLVAAEYRRTGVRAAFVYAGTPLEERRAMLRSFSAGDIQVIANCGVLTEGFDEPRADCIVVARPTKSRALFTQMIGRGTRKHPDKLDLLVLDVVGGSDMHSLVTVPSLFGVDPHEFPGLSDGSRDLTDVVADHQQRQVAIGRMKAEEADLFGRHRTKGIVWINMTDGAALRRYDRPLGYNAQYGYVELGRVVLVEREGGWLAGFQEPGTAGRKRVLIADVDLEMAQGVGEDHVRKVLGSRTNLIEAGAAWRKRPPTDRQLHAAKRWRLPGAASYATAGELSEALDAHIERKKARETNSPGGK